MGYQRKTYTLKWPGGHELAGLEVTTKGLPVKQLFRLTSLAGQLSEDSDVAVKVAAAEEMFTAFAARLIAWNLEDDGVPVPPTLEAVQEQDMDFMIGLIMTWMDAVASVDIPLPKPSPNGVSSATEPPGVASVPVETLSPSLLS